MMQSKGQAGRRAAKKGGKGRGSSSKTHPVQFARWSPEEISPGDSLKLDLQKGTAWASARNCTGGVDRS